MNWISAEAEKLDECMKKESVGYGFPSISNSYVSYFEDYNMEGAAVEEFGFSTIPELRKLLEKKKVVHSPEIDMICAVAAFKKKPDKSMEKSEKHALPTFIYNF